MTKTPTPDGAEMGERLRLVRSATIPPARDLQVARTERSPGFGRAARLPGFPVALSRYVLPVTVAGPRRARPRLPESPVACATGGRLKGGAPGRHRHRPPALHPHPPTPPRGVR